jgi:hypothetical protein
MKRPQRVGELLTAAVPALSERLLEERIRQEWPATVPAELSRRSEPGELRRGVLEIRVDNSPWLQELTMRAEEILAALTRRYGSGVTSLHCSLGPARAKATATGAATATGRSARPTNRQRLTADEAREIGAMTAPLRDPELARALRRLLTKDRLARPAASAGGQDRGETGPSLTPRTKKEMP